MKNWLILVLAFITPLSWSQVFVHPDYSFHLFELEEGVKDFPPEIKDPILKSPSEFMEDFKEMLRVPKEFLFLVDKNHHLPRSYVPEDLIDLKDYPIDITRDAQLRKVVMDDLLQMVSDAQRRNINLQIGSAYRSYSYQETLFQHWVNQSGYEEATRFSAKPGSSQHQLGTTIDFTPINESFAQTAASRWLVENAAFYGFSLSYPEGLEEITGYIYEPWHWRYVGFKATQFQNKWFGGIQHYMLTFMHRKLERIRSNYFPQEALLPR